MDYYQLNATTVRSISVHYTQSSQSTQRNSKRFYFNRHSYYSVSFGKQLKDFRRKYLYQYSDDMKFTQWSLTLEDCHKYSPSDKHGGMTVIRSKKGVLGYYIFSGTFLGRPIQRGEKVSFVSQTPHYFRISSCSNINSRIAKILSYFVDSSFLHN